MAKMRARRISGSRWVTRSGSRPSGITRASRSAMPSRRSAWANSMTPPSELIRPPSKAAVIFLRWTTGKQNGRRLSSVMAGVACLDPGKGLASATESYARSNAYATSVTANPPRHEYDGLVELKLGPIDKLLRVRSVAISASADATPFHPANAAGTFAYQHGTFAL